jgi:hypothetical protein
MVYPNSRNRFTLPWVAGCAYMSPSMAGPTMTGAPVARQVAVMMSSARPLAVAPSQRRPAPQAGVGGIGSLMADASIGLALQQVDMTDS